MRTNIILSPLSFSRWRGEPLPSLSSFLLSHALSLFISSSPQSLSRSFLRSSSFSRDENRICPLCLFLSFLSPLRAGTHDGEEEISPPLSSSLFLPFSLLRPSPNSSAALGFLPRHFLPLFHARPLQISPSRRERGERGKERRERREETIHFIVLNARSLIVAGAG